MLDTIIPPMLPPIERRPAPVCDADAAGTGMVTTTAAASDLNDVGIHARRWRQRHGVGNTECRNGASKKCRGKN
jgi:hypothetical protein